MFGADPSLGGPPQPPDLGGTTSTAKLRPQFATLTPSSGRPGPASPSLRWEGSYGAPFRTLTRSHKEGLQRRRGPPTSETRDWRRQRVYGRAVLTHPMTPRSGPSLRIEEFTITNFRTFTKRTVIPFRSGDAKADAIATFHGDNGSGKSNALAALDLFFDALTHYFTSESAKRGSNMPVAWNTGGQTNWGLAFRDRPLGVEEPTDLEARFADERLGTLRIRFIPAGNAVSLRADRLIVADDNTPLHFAPIHPSSRERFLTWIATPFGPGSTPCAVLDSHRRGSLRPSNEQAGSAFDTMLTEALFGLRTSFQPQDRDRWRTFLQLMQRFSTFRGRELSVDRITINGLAELTFEERGKSVLGLKELSSGEQQLVRLCAATVLIKSGLLAIQEPELSLDATNQRLFKELLREQINAGLRDQVIIESHVPTFDDGPSVIRFERGPAGETVVTRAPVANDARRRDLDQQAKSQGAEAQWVTRDGYTQLPDVMRGDLKLTNGGHLWFLKGQRTWEAWPEDQLAALLADPEEKKDDE